MPRRKEQFVNGEIYHIIVKGIDENLIFKDIDNHYRGIFSIYEFNNTKPVVIFKRRREIKAFKNRLRKFGKGRAFSILGETKNQGDRHPLKTKLNF